MYKRVTVTLILVLAALGLALFILNVLDIDEDYRVHWPANIPDTILISAIGIITAFIAARNYLNTGSRQTLILGCGMLAFGVGTLIRSWLIDYGLDASITIYEGTAVFASTMHLGGAFLTLSGQLSLSARANEKPETSIFAYLSVLTFIAILTLLVFLNVIPTFDIEGNHSTLSRTIVNGITILLFLTSSIFYLILYLKSHSSFFFWYSIGLMLFTLGVLFLSESSIDSRLYWLGKVTLYIGSIHFLITLFVVRHEIPIKSR
jgi:hypothetical protein